MIRQQTAYYKSPMTSILVTLTSLAILLIIMPIPVNTSGASFNHIQHRVQSEQGSINKKFEFRVENIESRVQNIKQNEVLKSRDHISEDSNNDNNSRDEITIKPIEFKVLNERSVKDNKVGTVQHKVHTEGSIKDDIQHRPEFSIKDEIQQGPEGFINNEIQPVPDISIEDDIQQGTVQNRVHLRSARVGFRTHPYFLSFAIDSSHVDEGLTKLHLTDPRLIALTSYLSPAYLRVGGIAADKLLFKPDTGESKEKGPKDDELSSKPDSSATNQKKWNGTRFFTGSDWLALHKFARLTNTRLVFDLNVLIRYNSSQESDVWNSTNAQELLTFSEKNALRNDWQLGNEPNAYKRQAGRPLLPEQLARDFRTLNTMLRQSQFHRSSLLIGPDITRPLKKNHCPEKGVLKNHQNESQNSTFNDQNSPQKNTPKEFRSSCIEKHCLNAPSITASELQSSGPDSKSSNSNHSSPNESRSDGTDKNYPNHTNGNERKEKELNESFPNETHSSRTDFDRSPNEYENTCSDSDDGIDPLDYIPPAEYMDKFLASGGSDVVNAVSFHQYYLDHNSSFLSYFSPETFESLRWQINTITEIVTNRFANHVQKPPIWLGETGSCVGGGVPNLTDTFAASFLWMDKLGLSARLGISVVIRQSLEIGNYSLTDVTTLTPNPDWWISVLYKRLVDNRVLIFATPNSRPTLRLYAHCSPRNNITLFGLNSGDELESISFAEPCTVYVYKLKQCWNEGVTSKNLCLNSIPLHLDRDLYLPKLKPVRIDIKVSNQYVVMEPRSLLFMEMVIDEPHACNSDS
uniref:Heparanase n=1 Tax=Cacopsylla melanoneura TaxID=428564 RepID=A0A8D8WSP1_9HEMI